MAGAGAYPEAESVASGPSPGFGVGL